MLDDVRTRVRTFMNSWLQLRGIFDLARMTAELNDIPNSKPPSLISGKIRRQPPRSIAAKLR